jgi:hypothetical protein
MTARIRASLALAAVLQASGHTALCTAPQRPHCHQGGGLRGGGRAALPAGGTVYEGS